MPFVVLFTFGIPLAVLTLICNLESTLEPATIRRYGFLWKQYKRTVPYWEVIEISRKITLTGMIVFIPETSRLFVYLLLFILSFESINSFYHHNIIFVRRLAQTAYLVTTVKYLAALLIENRDSESHGLGWALVIIDILFLLGCLIMGCLSLLILSKMFVKRGKQG